MTGIPRVDEIRWDLAPAPWPALAPLATAVVEHLPAIEDEHTAALVEKLALAIVERDEQLNAVREVKCRALEALHQAHRENERLRRRLIDARSRAKEKAAHSDSTNRQASPVALSQSSWSSHRRARDRSVATGHPKEDRQSRTEAALRILRSTQTAEGSPVETYLRARGITIPIPTVLRSHPALPHPSGGRYPAMVAQVSDHTDDPIAIHRTFLTSDGTAKAGVEPQKMMLGPCRGASVRLATPSDVLMVGEGIETCLAAMQATGHPAWAALSTSGLRTLRLPESIRDVIVLADGDEAGTRAAEEAAQRWSHEDRRVRIARPTNGSDFNDMLLGSEAGDEAIAP